MFPGAKGSQARQSTGWQRRGSGSDEGAVLGLLAEQRDVHIPEHQTQIQPGERAEVSGRVPARELAALPGRAIPSHATMEATGPGMSPQLFSTRSCQAA